MLKILIRIEREKHSQCSLSLEFKLSLSQGLQRKVWHPGPYLQYYFWHAEYLWRYLALFRKSKRSVILEFAVPFAPNIIILFICFILMWHLFTDVFKNNFSHSHYLSSFFPFGSLYYYFGLSRFSLYGAVDYCLVFLLLLSNCHDWKKFVLFRYISIVCKIRYISLGDCLHRFQW